MKEISIVKLSVEYNDWNSIHGDGRNSHDLRFGQYIWNNYNLHELFPNPSGISIPDGHAAEKAYDAYQQLIKLLNYKDEKQKDKATIWV